MSRSRTLFNSNSPEDTITDNNLIFELHIEMFFVNGEIKKDIRYVNHNHRDKMLVFFCDLMRWKKLNAHKIDCMDYCMEVIVTFCKN